MTIHFSNGRSAGNGTTVGLACLVAVLCTSVLEPTKAQTVRSRPTQNALAGAQVFGSEGCSRCHAINGLGGTEGPDLAQYPRNRTFYDLAAAMWNHGPSMVERMSEIGIERPRLNTRETGDLIAFLYALDYFDPAGDKERGRQIFAEKHCIICHQVGGVGGVVGPVLDGRSQLVAPIQIAAAMWNHGPAMSDAMRTRGISRPQFSQVELNDMITYLKGDAETFPDGPLYVVPGLVGDGRDVFSENGCHGCHSVQGSGGNLAPDLAERGAHRSLLAFAAAMWNKAPGMIRAMEQKGISIPQLRPEEMADLVGYLYSIKYFAQAGDRDRGRSDPATQA